MEDFAVESGYMKVYRDPKGNVRKLVQVLGHEIGRLSREYYLDNEEPRFVYEKLERYRHRLGESDEDSTVVGTEENRYYFAHGSLIRWVDEDKRRIPKTDHKFKEKQKEVLEYFDLLEKEWNDTKVY